MGFVLFLVAVLLIIVIVKMLPRSAWKGIAIVFGVIVLAGAGIVSYTLYREHSQEAARKANLLDYANDVQFYAISHRWTAADLENSPRATPQEVEYARQHADELKDAVWMPGIEEYAKRARAVKNLSALYVSEYTGRWAKNAAHLDGTGIDGVTDVIVLSDNYIVSDWEARELGSLGFKESVFIKYYSLDGSRVYSSKQRKWIESDAKSTTVFNSAHEN